MPKAKTYFKSISIARPDIGPLEKKYINEALNSGWISGIGPMVSRFERMFADFIGVRHGVAVANGTAALHLALMALGIGPGDEVIVPAFTFAATVNSVIHCGAKPVLVDASLCDWNMDPEKIKRAISKKTKAIIIVHLYGIPARLKEILEIARQRKIFLIEDAAEAHGALWGKKRTGSVGNIGCFSFFGNKIITTGEGGMCVTNSRNLYEKMKIIYSHGSKSHKLIYYYHPMIGHNFRMTNIQAALGLAQLSRINSFLKIRARHEDLYRRLLKNVPGIKFSPKPGSVTTVDWMHSILVDHPKVARNDVLKGLKEKNIESRPFFYPIHKMPPYTGYISRARDKFPVAEYLARTGINLPSSTCLSAGDISRVAEAVKEIIDGR